MVQNLIAVESKNSHPKANEEQEGIDGIARKKISVSAKLNLFRRSVLDRKQF